MGIALLRKDEMIISDKLIKKQRISRFCNNCENRIGAGQAIVILYGYAYYGDQPYVMYLCMWVDIIDYWINIFVR